MDEARRRAYLDALGIPVWVPRAGAQLRPKADPQGSGRAPGPAASAPTCDEGAGAVGGKAAPSASLGPGFRLAPAAGEATADAASPRAGISGLDWPALRERVAACTACALHATRTQTVFGVGNERARLMIVGEAPGADEDRQGEPFVGRAGQLLNAMLRAIGLQRGEVYIANVLKCRPPGNRNPSLEEAAACEGFLRRQIALIVPKLILSVGGISARNLLGTDTPVGRLRGTAHRVGPDGVPCVVTYHPAYLLRQPAEKAKAWQDLQLVARLLRDPE
jgi:uracil-DNA glycosylase family 4